MSVGLTVTWSDGSTEDHFLASQRMAEENWVDIARLHGFELITGVYPMSLLPEDLDNWTREVTILQKELPKQLPHTPELLEMWDSRMDKFLEVIRRLKKADGWNAYIG